MSIIGGSTPDWLQKMLPEDAFTGGFMSRFVIVEMPPTYFRRVAFPRQQSNYSWQDIVSGLNEFRRHEGEMEWSKNAEKLYRDHYENLIPTGNVQQDAYQERETEQLLKLAMLLALSEHEMLIRKWHMKKARQILNLLMEETAPRIERLATHPRMQLVQEIQDCLRTYGKMTRKQLLKKMYRRLAYGETQFQEAFRVLLMAGVINQEGSAANPLYSLKSRMKGKIQVR